MGYNHEAEPAFAPATQYADDLLDAAIERWWSDHFPGSAVARDTAAWNVAHAAKEALKRLLARGQSPPPAAVGGNDLQRSI
jgi:hypothetical protein